MNNPYIEIYNSLSRKKKLQGKIVCILSVLTALMEIISIGTVLPFITAIIYPEKIYNSNEFELINKILKIETTDQIIIWLGIFFISLILITSTLRIIYNWSLNLFCYKLGSYLGTLMFEKTLIQNYNYHIKTNSAKLVSGILGKTSSIIAGVFLPFFNILNALTLIIVALIVTIWINPIISIILFISVGIIYIILIKLTKNYLFKLSTIISKLIEENQQILNESYSGIREILLNNIKELNISLFAKKYENYNTKSAIITIISAIPKYVIESIFSMLIIGLAIFMMIKNYSSNEIISILAILVISAQRIIPSIHQMYSAIINIRGHVANVKSAVDLLKLKDLNIVNKNENYKINFQEKICFKNIKFAYTDNNYVLENVNLTFKKGYCYGFYGASGNGKSTFLDILIGLLKPNDGSIYIDNTILDVQNLKSWQANVSYVSQKIFLLDKSVAENIALGLDKCNIDYTKLQIVAELTCIDKAINNLPAKFDTKIGENGVIFSGGQKQKIALARALYKSCNVIILDEATSSLDKDNENEIINLIKNLKSKVTFFIVSHSENVLKACDKIYKFENGKIVNEI